VVVGRAMEPPASPRSRAECGYLEGLSRISAPPTPMAIAPDKGVAMCTFWAARARRARRGRVSHRPHPDVPLVARGEVIFSPADSRNAKEAVRSSTGRIDQGIEVHHRPPPQGSRLGHPRRAELDELISWSAEILIPAPRTSRCICPKHAKATQAASASRKCAVPQRRYWCGWRRPRRQSIDEVPSGRYLKDGRFWSRPTPAPSHDAGG